MLRVPGACGVAGLRNTPGRTGVPPAVIVSRTDAAREEIGRPDGGGVSRRP